MINNTCQTVEVPTRPGHCFFDRAKIYCAEATGDFDLDALRSTHRGCFTAADWEKCMSDAGSCASMQAQSFKLLLSSPDLSAQYQQHQMWNACIAEKTCQAYADVTFPRFPSLAAFLEKKALESENCYYTKEADCKAITGCFWSKYEQYDGLCIKKADVMGFYETADKHPDCFITKTVKFDGWMEGEKARLDLYDSKMKCEAFKEEELCAADAVCAWTTGVYCNEDDAKTERAPSENFGGCRFVELSDRGTAAGKAARKDKLAFMFGEAFDAVIDIAMSCEAIKDSAACAGAELTAAEKESLQPSEVVAANAQSYTDLATLGLVVSGIAIFAFAQG